MHITLSCLVCTLCARGRPQQPSCRRGPNVNSNGRPCGLAPAARYLFIVRSPIRFRPREPYIAACLVTVASSRMPRSEGPRPAY